MPEVAPTGATPLGSSRPYDFSVSAAVGRLRRPGIQTDSCGLNPGIRMLTGGVFMRNV